MKPKPITVSLTQFAEIVEAHRVTVSTWVTEGLPILKRRAGANGAHTINLVQAFRWLLKRNQAMADEAVAAARSTPELDELRRRKLAAEAGLAEVNLREREAELIPAADVAPRWERLVVAARERFLSIAPVAVQRGLVAPENEEAVAELAHDALAELAEARP